ncbi:hypothetical protein FE783_19320 [Paenibacillus mesophilus]|uniref:hypothetical protein n=1 Tax=Paenibacillus mesophilus TaxID=2582849 RepID=UPI00110E1F50|nr:hypothetical protein [Paenibacillus mesophilus]TMV48105.1 hypothetical protein FE783_19320 [Paenibacillus mesophilus]
MRAVIKARLADELSALAGRCYDLHEPSSTTVKPYATVKLVGQEETSPWIGMKRTYEIALHEETDSAAALDELADQAVQALHGIKLSGGASARDFTCQYEGLAASERVDDTLQALVQVLRFSVYAVGSEENLPSDACLQALCDWTATIVNSEWQVYRQRWPQDYTIPAVLWRLDQVTTADRDASTIELGRNVVGHVLGRTDEERLAMVGTLAEKLGSTTKLPIEPLAKRFIVPVTVTAVYGADGLTEGQLTATLRQIVQKTVPNWPLIGQVHYDGGFG